MSKQQYQFVWSIDKRQQNSVLPVIKERPQLQTLQTIEAQSQMFIDSKSIQVDLISKLFLLSIQIQRKQQIISELLSAHSQYIEQINKFNQHIKIIEEQNFILKQNNQKINLQRQQMLSKVTEYNVYRNQQIFINEMEQKIYKLESKNRKIQNQKIQLQQTLNKTKITISQLQFDKVKKQTEQNSKIRFLESQVNNWKSKLQNQQVVIRELRFLNENYNLEIKNLKQKQNIINKAYQEKIKSIQAKRNFEEEQQLYKIKQNMHTQQKIALLSQQLNRLSQQVQYLRKCLSQKDLQINKRENQILRLQNSIGQYHNSYLTTNKQAQDFNHYLKATQLQIKQSKKEINILKDQILKQKQQINLCNTKLLCKDNQIIIKNQQISNLTRQINDLNLVIFNYKQTLKSQKQVSRINNCERCNLNLSQTNYQLINLSIIIEQAQKLKISNKMIQTLLNKTSIHSIYGKY